MTVFALALASNIKPREHLCQALAALATLGRCTMSNTYQMPCRDGIGADYYNVAVLLEAQHDSETIQHFIKQLEMTSGRIRPSHEISLDVDLIAWGNDLNHMQFNAKKLPLPLDVMVPLRDIWSNLHAVCFSHGACEQYVTADLHFERVTLE